MPDFTWRQVAVIALVVLAFIALCAAVVLEAAVKAGGS